MAEPLTRTQGKRGGASRAATRTRRAAAYGVHLYTASGAVFAFLIVVAALRGDVRLALGLEFITMFVDGTDGWLARRLHVSRLVAFDGGKLDDIVDYLTYVFAPVVLLWTAAYLPHGTTGYVVAALPLLASCYQFCQANAKTADHYFLGFPSYWNIVAFYVIVCHAPPPVVGVLLVVCALLVFVPIKYVYPSRTVPWYRVTLALTALWLLLYVVLVVQLPHPNPRLTGASLVYVVYYVGLSLHLTYSTRTTRTGAPRLAPRQPAATSVRRR